MIVSVGDFMLDVLVGRRRDADGVEGAVDRLSLEPGGSAANVAAWLAHLGADAGFAGAAGRDLAGDLLIGDLQRRGIATAIARIPGARTGILLLETMPDGTRRPAARRGANDLLPIDGEQRALLARASWIHLSSYAFYPESAREPLLDAIAEARRRGVPLSIDLGAPHVARYIGAAAYRALLRRAAPMVLLANEEEARDLAGSGAGTGSAPSELLDTLAAHAPIAVLKRGPAGCAVSAGAERFEVPAADGPVVDTVGAGDAFVAGFIDALRRGASHRAAALAAVAAAAACIAMVGGRPPLGDS